MQFLRLATQLQADLDRSRELGFPGSVPSALQHPSLPELVRCVVCEEGARNGQATQLQGWQKAAKTYARISHLSNALGLP